MTTTARHRRQSGFTLVGVLVAASLMGILGYFFMQMMKSQTGALQRNVARGGVADLSSAVDLLLSSAGCADMSAGGGGPHFQNGGAQARVTVSGATYALTMDTMRFANGSVALSNAPPVPPEIERMIHPFTLAPNSATPPGIELLPLGGHGPVTGGFQFPFQMNVSFQSPSGTPPPVPFSKFFVVYTNFALRVIGACAAGGPVSVPASCPTGQFITSLNPFTCATP